MIGRKKTATPGEEWQCYFLKDKVSSECQIPMLRVVK